MPKHTHSSIKHTQVPAEEALGSLGQFSLTKSQENSLKILQSSYRVPLNLLNRTSQIIEHAVVIAALVPNQENQGGYLPVSGGFPYSRGRTKRVILLSTMFKMGSMSIANSFWKHTMEQNTYDTALLKTHHPSWACLLSHHLPRHVKLSIVQIFGRSDMSRYVSAFFQDIVAQQGYAYRNKDGTYASREDVLRENPERLRMFFSKQNWRDVIWLNPESYVDSASVALGGTSFVSRTLKSLVQRANLEIDSTYVVTSIYLWLEHTIKKTNTRTYTGTTRFGPCVYLVRVLQIT